MCNGTDKTCPGDEVAGTDVVCLAQDGVCDVADMCNGTDKTCPGDEVAGTDVVCRPAVDPVCDLPENCNGTDKTCTATDLYTAAGTPCDDENACSMVDVCNATGGCVGTALCTSGVTSPFVGLDTGQTNKRIGLCLTDETCDAAPGETCTSVEVLADWGTWIIGDGEAMADCDGYWAYTSTAQAPGDYCYQFYATGGATTAWVHANDQSDACIGGTCTGTGGDGFECVVTVPSP